MATKQEIFDMMQSYKSRKCFQPKDFTGKTTDNARDFISTFKNYCKLNNIDDADALLSFEMCLSGAAKCWFNGLSKEIKKNFKLIEEQFNKNFLQNNQWLINARLENRKLLPTESAEKYIADMSELAQLVGITDSELSKALIRGLPTNLKWNVISYHPVGLSETIQRILLGEATLSVDDTADINAIGDDKSAIDRINQRVDCLEELIKTTLLQSQRYERPPVVVCQICGISGHYTSNCSRSTYIPRPSLRNDNTLDGQLYATSGSSEQQFNEDYLHDNCSDYNNNQLNNDTVREDEIWDSSSIVSTPTQHV